jgi:hypothetical protein
MNCYTLSNPGIKIENYKIILGEEGQGREQEIIEIEPVRARFDFSRDRYVSKVINPLTGEVLFAFEEEKLAWEKIDEYQAKGVKLQFRKELYQRERFILWYRLPEEQPGDCLVFVPAIYGFRGNSEIIASESVKIVAEGVKADGLAGRMASGREYLLVVNKGGWFTLKVTGRRVEREERKFINIGDKVIENVPDTSVKI